MGIFDRLLGSKKKTLKMASDAVNFVKVGLLFYLLPECKANFDENYSETLAAAVINTIFSEIPSNETGKDFMKNETNIVNINLVIEKSIKPEEKLRQIITDAVRVKCIVAHGINANLSEDEFKRQCQYPIDQLRKLQILQKGGETPNLSNFIINASSFMNACKKDYELNKNT
ncbi:MAG: hypothetical protein P9M00_00125 [Candidatus Tritonobacter lacicola]|nr:hypothetical protein [Candidatus Tritonobacter lacicola]